MIIPLTKLKSEKNHMNHIPAWRREHREHLKKTYHGQRQLRGKLNIQSHGLLQSTGGPILGHAGRRSTVDGVGHCSHRLLLCWDACIYMSVCDPSSVVKERKFHSLVVQRLIGGSFLDSKREVYRLEVQGLRERVQLLLKNQVSCNIYGRNRSLTQRIPVGCCQKSSRVATRGNLVVAMLSRIAMSRLCINLQQIS